MILIIGFIVAKIVWWSVAITLAFNDAKGNKSKVRIGLLTLRNLDWPLELAFFLHEYNYRKNAKIFVNKVKTLKDVI